MRCMIRPWTSSVLYEFLVAGSARAADTSGAGSVGRRMIQATSNWAVETL